MHRARALVMRASPCWRAGELAAVPGFVDTCQPAGRSALVNSSCWARRWSGESTGVVATLVAVVDDLVTESPTPRPTPLARRASATTRVTVRRVRLPVRAGGGERPPGVEGIGRCVPRSAGRRRVWGRNGWLPLKGWCLLWGSCLVGGRCLLGGSCPQGYACGDVGRSLERRLGRNLGRNLGVRLGPTGGCPVGHLDLQSGHRDRQGAVRPDQEPGQAGRRLEVDGDLGPSA